MTDLNYDPSAQFNVTTTDLFYLELPGMALGATVYLPQGPGPFPGLLDIYGGAWNFGQRSGDEPMLLALALQRYRGGGHRLPKGSSAPVPGPGA